MRYGLPSGIQFFLEIFGFTFFIQMLGRFGNLELAVSNIALSIESLAFLPMVGFHIGTVTLVGQAMGKGRPEEGAYATISAFHITLLYMMIVAAIFIFLPGPLLHLFQSNRYSTAQFDEILGMGVILMRFVALFCFFDALNLVFSGALKGAGDTRFIMWTIGALSIGRYDYSGLPGDRSHGRRPIYGMDTGNDLRSRIGNRFYAPLRKWKMETDADHRILKR